MLTPCGSKALPAGRTPKLTKPETELGKQGTDTCWLMLRFFSMRSRENSKCTCVVLSKFLSRIWGTPVTVTSFLPHLWSSLREAQFYGAEIKPDRTIVIGGARGADPLGRVQHAWLRCSEGWTFVVSRLMGRTGHQGLSALGRGPDKRHLAQQGDRVMGSCSETLWARGPRLAGAGSGPWRHVRDWVTEHQSRALP